jgi:N-acetylgalactosamine kinase
MPTTGPLYTIILAGGKGSRMRSRERHKVCFEVGGVPAIVRAIEAYNLLGVAQNIVVVGEMAGQVLETVGRRFDNVVFAYQAEARGTGDAARCGLRALSGVEDRARILVVAGDKIIEGATLGRLLEHANQTSADLTLLVSPAATASEGAGRILFRPDGSPLGIVEAADVRLRACRDELRHALTSESDEDAARAAAAEIVARHLGPDATWRAVLGQPKAGDQEPAGPRREEWLVRLRDLPHDFHLAPETPRILATDAARSRFVNESVYLVRKGALRYGLDRMTTDNAQGEEYLTDAIGAVLSAADGRAPRYRASVLVVERAGEIMSFNNPEELLAIEERLRGQRERTLEALGDRLGESRYRSVDAWLALLPEPPAPAPSAEEVLRTYYGDDPALIAERRRHYRRVMLRFRDAFGGARRAVIVRSPGRINILGRHIDWQGGHCNLMAVDQEAILVASPRHDDRIEIRNVRPEAFPDVSISLARVVSQLDWDDWMSCVNGQELQRRLRRAAGEWGLYIEAALLRLQMEFRHQRLAGMDLCVDSNIPMAAGMSSSSALVVATAEAATALNGLDLAPRQFVNFCGEGEWFVGTRGGSADHAAMKFGSKGMVSHVKFHEFELVERVRFPATHRMVVCNSFVQAKKAAGARAAFNARVASYLLGVALVRKAFPPLAPLVRFVRDIEPERLGVPVARIYEVLRELPESISSEEARTLFGDDPETWARLKPHLSGTDSQGEYPVRGVMLYGIGECARACEAVECLRRSDMAAFGRLMNTSHEGERRFRVADDLSAEPCSSDISDAYLAGRIADLESDDPARVERAGLANQPGAYQCSTREVDALVDIAIRTPGVLGAQIAGAGLGGCAMVLAEEAAVVELERRLNALFYAKQGLPSGVYVCTPAAGSRVVAIES